MGRTDETIYVTEEFISELEKEMMAAADALEFERAAGIRDKITQLRDQVGNSVAESDMKKSSREKARGRGRQGVGQRIPRLKK